MRYFSGKGCGLSNPTTVSAAGVTLSAAGLWSITFNRSILEKFTMKIVTKSSWGRRNKVTVRCRGWKGGVAGEGLLLFLKCSRFGSVAFVFFIRSWRFTHRKLKGKTRGHRPQVRCNVKAVCLSLLSSKQPILQSCCEEHSVEFPGPSHYTQGRRYCNYYSKALMWGWTPCNPKIFHF